jgi:hypothetical protein
MRTLTVAHFTGAEPFDDIRGIVRFYFINIATSISNKWNLVRKHFLENEYLSAGKGIACRSLHHFRFQLIVLYRMLLVIHIPKRAGKFGLDFHVACTNTFARYIHCDFRIMI